MRQDFEIAFEELFIEGKLWDAGVKSSFPYGQTNANEDAAGDGPVEEAAKRDGIPLRWVERFDGGALVLLWLGLLGFIFAVCSEQDRSSRNKRFAIRSKTNRSHRNKWFELALLAHMVPRVADAQSAYFAVTSGRCTVDPSAWNCIRSPNFPYDYVNSQTCSITPTALAIGRPLTATSFITESCCDYLRIPSHPSGTLTAFSGWTGPSNFILGPGTIQWSSDSRVTHTGWRVCAGSAGSAGSGGIARLVELTRSGSAVEKENAAAELSTLAYNNADNQVAIARAGGIAPLVELTRSGSLVAKEKAAGALWTLAYNADNRVAIARTGGIAPLVELTRSGSAVAKEKAAGALWNLAVNADNKVAIARAGGIAPLVELTRSGSAMAKEHAAAALWNLAVNADNSVAIGQAGGIAPLVQLTLSGSAVAKQNAAAALWTLALNDDNKVAIAQAGGNANDQAAIAQAGGIVTLVELTRSGGAAAKEQAAGALWVLTRNATNSVAIARAGGIAPLVELTRSGSAMAKEHAAAALWNLAVNADNSVAIGQAGGIAPLVQLTLSGSAVAKEKAAGALWNLALNADNSVAIARAGGIAPLVELTRSGSAEAKEKAAGALRTLAVNDDNKVAIAQAGGIAPLVELTRSGSAEAKESAAAALRNLAVNADNKVAIARAGGIAPLVELTRSGSLVAKEKAAGALWTLAYNADNRVAIARTGGIAPLVELTCSGNAVAKEHAAGALWNLALNTDNSVAIARAGGIAPLVELTRSGSAEAKEKAAGALRTLAVNDDNKVAIAQAGGIAPLVELTRSGSAVAKEKAAGALLTLALDADNRVAISRAGLVKFTDAPLVELTAAVGAHIYDAAAAVAVIYAAATLLAIAIYADNRAAIAGYHLPFVFWLFLLASGLVWVCLLLACFWLLRAYGWVGVGLLLACFWLLRAYGLVSVCLLLACLWLASCCCTGTPQPGTPPGTPPYEKVPSDYFAVQIQRWWRRRRARRMWLDTLVVWAKKELLRREAERRDAEQQREAEAAAKELRDRATALGLLQVLTDAGVADDATLKKSIAWCVEEGVTNVSDIVKHNLVDKFVLHLDLKHVPVMELRRVLLLLLPPTSRRPISNRIPIISWLFGARRDPFVLLPETDASTLSSLEKLLQTEHPKWLGKGQDVSKRYGPYDKLKLACAWKVDHPILLSKYNTGAERVQQELKQLQNKGQSVTTVSGLHVKTDGVFATSEDCNEVILLHGTNPDRLFDLLSTGLNERFAVNGAFGDGIYLAEDAGKTDQYVSADSTYDQSNELHKRLYDETMPHPEDVFYVLVVRAALGFPVRTQRTLDDKADTHALRAARVTSMDNGAPIFPDNCRELSPVPGVTPKIYHHSLIAELGKNIVRYREFVLFHSEYVHIDYVIAYHRYNGDRKLRTTDRPVSV